MTGVPARKPLGSASDPRVKPYQRRIDAVDALEMEHAALSDDELRARTGKFQQQLGTLPKSPRSRTNLR